MQIFHQLNSITRNPGNGDESFNTSAFDVMEAGQAHLNLPQNPPNPKNKKQLSKVAETGRNPILDLRVFAKLRCAAKFQCVEGKLPMG
jgi:hypothetical protein